MQRWAPTDAVLLAARLAGQADGDAVRPSFRSSPRSKNDRYDAEAIANAARPDNMRIVAVKDAHQPPRLGGISARLAAGRCAPALQNAKSLRQQC